MTLQPITTRFLRYNHWANERLTTWLLSLDPAILYTHTPSSFGTIDRTLHHIVAAQTYWHTLLTTGQIPEFDLPYQPNAVKEIIADVITTSQHLLRDLEELTDHQLTETLQASDSRQSRYEYILHVVNHSSYHRGQIVILCRALGITDDIPVTDYDAYLWWVENH